MAIEKGQTTIFKTLHRKLKIGQHEPHIKTGGNSYHCFVVPFVLVMIVAVLFSELRLLITLRCLETFFVL
jgi:hypothetical protein